VEEVPHSSADGMSKTVSDMGTDTIFPILVFYKTTQNFRKQGNSANKTYLK
jgi:hypothetical protein